MFLTIMTAVRGEKHTERHSPPIANYEERRKEKI